MSVGELADRYIADHTPHWAAATPETVRRTLARILIDPEQIAADVTAELAAEWYAAAREGRAAATHHKSLAAAKRLWAWGQDEELIPQGNPWRKLRAHGRPNAGKRQFRIVEARAFVETALADRSAVAPALLCALLCGMRTGEILALTPDDVEAGLIWIRGGKTVNARRTIPVPQALSDRLRRAAMAAGPGGRLFPFCRTWLRRELQRLCREAGVPYVSPHGLRGTFATLAVLGSGGPGGSPGGAVAAVADAIGHGGASGTRCAERHYIDPSAVAAATSAAALGALGVG